MSDAFQGPTSWNGFMNAGSGINHVYFDTHHYEVFDESLLAHPVDQHVANVCEFGKQQLANTDKWVIVGEWSGALTDCAKYLNGRGKGARFDQTYTASENAPPSDKCNSKSSGSVAGLSDNDKEITRRFIEAQLDAFSEGTGWAFWTWKTEGAPEWDMKQLLAEGVFPQPLTDRKYPGQCG